ncbi:hypothetical protein QO034_16905 [Sedimentitalea sp. JM2-8]|uniref:Uncharacterized protein n=1 Tax=Sedimentitalea xiamensis TaxID=3050037 RepID=A0ABT7FI04_9RHOB|nr:hypothetical protein [Sedimentitalea xiamensis]MDK3074771.1 hypothetical protein [Sedimentitalea xiamensis]
MADFVERKATAQDDIHVKVTANIPCFLPAALTSRFSYVYLELYWTRFRRPYLDRTPAGAMDPR